MAKDFFSTLNVSRETLQKLEQYQALLVKWQRAVNLVSHKTISESWERHFVDSAQLLPLISENIKIAADIGSGAGFPGLVLAVLRPDIEYHFIESDDKKCQFLRTVSRETQLDNVVIHNDRVENCADKINPDLVTARALASLDALLKYTEDWHNRENFVALFLKGQNAQEEIQQAQKLYSFDIDCRKSITNLEAQILKISSIKSL